MSFKPVTSEVKHVIGGYQQTYLRSLGEESEVPQDSQHTCSFGSTCCSAHGPWLQGGRGVMHSSYKVFHDHLSPMGLVWDLVTGLKSLQKNPTHLLGCSIRSYRPGQLKWKIYLFTHGGHENIARLSELWLRMGRQRGKSRNSTLTQNRDEARPHPRHASSGQKRDEFITSHLFSRSSVFLFIGLLFHCCQNTSSCSLLKRAQAR